MAAGLGPAMTPRTVRVGDENAHRRVALHQARQDDAAARGSLREAELSLESAAAKAYTEETADEREAARERALRAYERILSARADVAIVAAAVDRLGGRR